MKEKQMEITKQDYEIKHFKAGQIVPSGSIMIDKYVDYSTWYYVFLIPVIK